MSNTGRRGPQSGRIVAPPVSRAPRFGKTAGMTPGDEPQAGPQRSSPLLDAHEFFRRGPVNAEGWSMLIGRDRRWERSYRDRWAHDKVVRSTHGVNCTGSCSWEVYVKEGIITWENQATDYPSMGPDMPDHEPRGCPRGASFSWYTYSPLRIKHPLVRGSLLERFRAEKETNGGDPVAAWTAIQDDPGARATYVRQRGKGGFVRASWEEAAELIAAAHVHTIARQGPDRIAGFTPLPAMSPVSFASGSRFVSLIGGSLVSFYDWYADLPPASPQTFGDQTDVPESADWWNSSYLIVWGTNIPITRTPDAHFMTEARYRGQKVVVVSPDYSDHTTFADDWLPAQPGTDGALAMAMGHVVLREFWVDREVPRFRDYAKQFTDLPLLVTLAERDDGTVVPDRFLCADDLGSAEEHAAWKPVVLDEATDAAAVPNGSAGFRYGEQGAGRWNLDLGAIDPLPSLYDTRAGVAEVTLARFDQAGAVGSGDGGTTMVRGVPVRIVGGRRVTTVLDLLLATYGVARPGLPGTWPEGYDDARSPYTPAWQEAITGVDRVAATKVAREFARNAEVNDGRSMIAMGAGTNHWFHSDQTYRSFLTLLLVCGCVGRNGGGWAHYVGQEKIRTFVGWQQLAMGLDWRRPARLAQGTSFYYTAVDQWRYERIRPEELASPVGSGRFRGVHTLDAYVRAVRMGWLPSAPAFDRNPLDLADAAQKAVDAGEADSPAAFVARELRERRLHFAAEDPDAPENWPRVLTVWRSNILGSSAKGHEYFLRHLLGVTDDTVTGVETPPELRPREVRWREEAPRGKLDLFVNADFRMTSTALHADVVLPAATWYEKHDLSMTDMHPFVHSFNAAIAPPWEARTDWDAFRTIAATFSELARDRLGVRRDLLALPIQHDTPGEIAQPHGRVLDWARGECDPIPGVTMPGFRVVSRDYGAVAEQLSALGPLVETAGVAVKGASWRCGPEVDWLRAQNGPPRRDGPAAGRPRMDRDIEVAEVMLALSGVSNGRVAQEGFRSLEARTGVRLADLARQGSEHRITFRDTQTQPRHVATSPEWSGIDARDRRYAAFTLNTERLKPFHTLSGRMHLYQDHEWMLELGEALPAFRPPLRAWGLGDGEELASNGERELTLRYLTPHSKWSIHSEFQDNQHMLTLFRGGPVLWLSREDAEALEVRDDDWIEAYNRNGIVACRAVVSHRLPEGTCMLYHAKDRHLNTPRTELRGNRGGTENSLTRITMKPTHLIGGYAHLSWGFNYYGPTGSNRDEMTVVRKRRAPVEF